MHLITHFIKKQSLIRSFHSVSLARACLPISENADVLSVDARLYKWFNVVEDSFLRTIGSKDAIEKEIVLFPFRQAEL